MAVLSCTRNAQDESILFHEYSFYNLKFSANIIMNQKNIHLNEMATITANFVLHVSAWNIVSDDTKCWWMILINLQVFKAGVWERHVYKRVNVPDCINESVHKLNNEAWKPIILPLSDKCAKSLNCL